MSYPITGELYAAGFRWREELESEDLLVANKGSLYGGAAISNGLVLNGATGYAVISEFRHLRWINGAYWVHVEFTPNFAASEAVTRYLLGSEIGVGKRFYIRRSNTGSLQVVVGSASAVSVALGTWSPHWRQGERNTIAICLESGVNNDIWLNGVLVRNTANAWVQDDPPERLVIGANALGVDNWSGVVHRVHFGEGRCTQEDIDQLQANTLQSAILPSRYLLCVTGDAPTIVGFDTVTRCTGTAGVRAGILGAGVSTPGGPHRRAFLFDGVDDTITIRSNEALQFTDGAGDIPFTAALVFKPEVAAALRHVVGVASGAAAGAWYVAYDGNNGRVHFRGVDNTAGAYIGRSATVGSAPLHRNQILVCTDDGSGTAAGLRIYDRSGRIDAADDNSGVYVRRRLTATDLLFGGPGGAAAPVQGDAGLLTLLPGAASPMQAAMLAYRLEQYRMVTR